MLKTIQSEGPNAGVYVLLHAKLCLSRYNLTLKLSLTDLIAKSGSGQKQNKYKLQGSLPEGLGNSIVSTGRCLYTFL